MKTFLIGLIGLGAIAATALLGQMPAFGGESACCPATAGNACCDCCPNCGCRLVPVCQMTCTPKKTTTNKYSCVCKDICIPAVTRMCDGHDGCNSCCQSCNEGCCRVREVHKLVIHPVTKETQVRGCTVQWTCPNCGGRGPCTENSVPSVSPMPASPAAPVPLPSTRGLPPAPKVTDGPALPENIRMAGTGF
jgi:hypothetical protein